MINDDNVKRVLTDDGLPSDSLQTFHEYENKRTVSLDDLRSKLGMNSWAVRIAYNDRIENIIIMMQMKIGLY